MEKEIIEKENKEEEVILHHFLHEHPLTLIEKTRVGEYCYGCFLYFSGEAGYECSQKCGEGILLHEECAEMPREITHPMHPHHKLNQNPLPINPSHDDPACAVCDRIVCDLGYTCTDPSCTFRIHVGCAPNAGVINSLDDQERQSMKHDSHPEHELRMLRRSRRSCSFRCDACGTIERGSSYVCSVCQYWIHESCALLAPELVKENLHHHPLFLSFHLPKKYIHFEYNCDICHKNLFLKHWVYHCESCGYVVHIKCAINASSAHATSKSHNADADDKDIIEFPINNVSEELIRPFVKRCGEEIFPNAAEIVYTFHNHHHPLKLVTLISSQENDQKVKIYDEYDDDNYEQTSELICDGCITPIHHKNTNKSTSSSDKYKYYLSCSTCKYFLHWSCFQLPQELPSLPLHNQHHTLTLQTAPKLNFTIGTVCNNICNLETNGLYYSCTGCTFVADIKCSSLPNVIKHAGHPEEHHHLKLLTIDKVSEQGPCGACYEHLRLSSVGYRCTSCEFSLHARCALLPATNHHRWDKHTLPLTYDAKLNHPTDFYCEFCEKEMNPKLWMYHCRQCDVSFHPVCLHTTSGNLRNFKLGQRYLITECHPHPLLHRVINIKQHCDLCGDDEGVYNFPGFQCAPCNFVMCLYTCGQQYRDAIQDIL